MAKKAEGRISRLLEMLRINQKLEIDTVAEALGVSEATVRRLFVRLDREGKVIRTHGGVRLAPQLGVHYSYSVSASHRSREKAAIGHAAAELIESGEEIYLDSGTTVLKLAESMSQRFQAGDLDGVTVLTNSLVLVDVLARWCKVILPGGEARTDRRDLCGPVAEESIRRFRVSRAFFGADAVHLTGGFMTTDERTASLNSLAIRGAGRSYVLADAEKFGRDAFVSYATLADVDLVITDASLPEATLTAFRNAGTTVKAVSPRATGKAQG